jgi:hypothetical protein
MREWSSYGLSDFLLFSPRVYYRLIESYNRDVWPAQIVAMIAGIAASWLVLRRGGPRHGQLVAVILAAAWLWTGWAFQLQRYATINWAARWFALAFGVEALLLIWSAVARSLRFDTTGLIRGMGLAVVVLVLFGMPMLAPLAGRSWAGIEVFGVHADPTAVLTLGILLASARVHWPLMVIPLAWCGVSGATSVAMDSLAGAVLLAGGALILIAAVWKTYQPSVST